MIRKMMLSPTVFLLEEDDKIYLMRRFMMTTKSELIIAVKPVIE